MLNRDRRKRWWPRGECRNRRHGYGSPPSSRDVTVTVSVLSEREQRACLAEAREYLRELCSRTAHANVERSESRRFFGFEAN